jgi:hypothetical protein
MIYTAPCVNAFVDAGRILYLASGRGLGTGNLEFFGPQMALAYRFNAISQDQKKSRFSEPNTLPLALVMDADAARIKIIRHEAV